jgi:two-component system cell cycle response regulator DivK
MSDIKILVVEDNEISMMLAHDLLKLAGYAVLKAYSAEAAIQMAQAERPNLIVMDIGLPKMDGLTATGILKADPETAAIPIVALTAHAMPGDKERMLRAGCDFYFAKPFDVKVFLDTVAGFVGGK